MDTNIGNPRKSLLKQLDRLRKNTEEEPPPPIFLLLNKAEESPPTKRTEVKRVCKTRHGDRFRDVTLISALRLDDSDDAAPLDALQAAMRRIRDALMRRDPFEALMSAQVSAEMGTEIYRMKIDGEVYEAPASSDSSLASREQLEEMVRSVAAERHLLLERQFQRSTTELQKEWQQTCFQLDKALQKELRESSGVSDRTDDIKSKALERIDTSKSQILEQVDEIINEAIDEIVIKGPPRTEEGWFFVNTFHRIDIRFDRMHKLVADRDRWNRISDVNKNLLSFLKKLTGTIPDPPQNILAKELRKECVKLIRGFQKGVEESAKDGGWEVEEKGFFRKEFKDDDEARDELYNEISDRYEQLSPELNLALTHVVQVEIDRLQETVISFLERNLSQNQGRSGEMAKLQRRIEELKENTP